MFEGIVKAIIVAVAAIVFVASFHDEWKRLRADKREYDAFQASRVRRQADFDRHAIAVAHRELIDAWVEITATWRCWHE